MQEEVGDAHASGNLKHVLLKAHEKEFHLALPLFSFGRCDPTESLLLAEILEEEAGGTIARGIAGLPWADTFTKPTRMQ